MSLTVLDPGLASRVVDFGRPRGRALGVPVGGAADRAALALGNALVGNVADAPALEICLKGPILRANVPLGAVLFGAPFAISSARQALEAGTTFSLTAGEEIHIGVTASGMRAYLCVRKGLIVPEVLGSRSGLENITGGMVLDCAPSSIRARFLRPFSREPTASAAPARALSSRLKIDVLPGLQASWFDEREFFEHEFTVTPALDRMGVRLGGRLLTIPERELVSEPVGPGAVQVTRDGACIILGVDGQTVGGYPKIAQVIQADWDLIAQVRPGDRIRFDRVRLDEAAQRFREYRAWLAESVMRLQVSLAGL